MVEKGHHRRNIPRHMPRHIPRDTASSKDMENYDSNKESLYLIYLIILRNYKKNTVICVTYIRVLKETLDHGLILEKGHRVVEFNQDAWIKQYIDMNTELRAEAKNNF